MIAYITSIDEPTTNLCEWSLNRNGFEVKVLNDSRTLAHKLKAIYNNIDEDFVRVDADVVPNKNLKPDFLSKFRKLWWYQFLTYDWYLQGTTHGGVQFIKKESLPALRANIDSFLDAERPESQMYRLDEFHNPRRCKTVNAIMGLHGYGQTDIERVKQVKERRGQHHYDWELVKKLEEVC